MEILEDKYSNTKLHKTNIKQNPTNGNSTFKIFLFFPFHEKKSFMSLMKI